MLQDYEKMDDLINKSKSDTYDKKVNNMENNNLDTSDVLLYRGLSGGYGGYGTREPYDGTVVNNNVNRNAADIATQNSFTREVINEQGTDNKLAALLATINSNANETQRDISDARAEAAKCCCETQKLIVQENGETRALINANRIAELESKVASQAADANQASILAAMNAQTALLATLCERQRPGGGQ